MKSFLVTAALPYANGPIHIGHLAGAYLPADFYVRFLKMQNRRVLFICGTDEHGAAISLEAQKRGVSPRVIVDENHQKISQIFNTMNIAFDFFGRTTSDLHQQTTINFFESLLKNGFIMEKEEEQFYCDQSNTFLPDRYIRGLCPFCKNKARGDECSSCGRWLDSKQLLEPYSDYCEGEISLKKTKHWYLDLPALSEKLKQWVNSKKGIWKDNVLKFVLSWIQEGLEARSITRDLDWGIPVPLKEAQYKVFYVWFDAPIGYISMTKEYSRSIGQNDLWKEFWCNESTQLVHFIGKDNIPFHAIVWPAMLMGQDVSYVLPTFIPANEYLTLEGEKISTSQGNSLWVEDLLSWVDVDYVRYYLAYIAPEQKDANFTFLHFYETIQSDLVNNFGNLIYRIQSFSKNHFSQFSLSLPKVSLLIEFVEEIDQSIAEVYEAYEWFKIKEVIHKLMTLSKKSNVLFQSLEPWKRKDQKEFLEELLKTLFYSIYKISRALMPIMPKKMQEILTHLGIDSIYREYHFDSFLKHLRLQNPKVFFEKIDLQLLKAKEKKFLDQIQNK